MKCHSGTFTVFNQCQFSETILVKTTTEDPLNLLNLFVCKLSLPEELHTSHHQAYKSSNVW